MEKLREVLAEQYHNAKKEDFVITNGASEALDLVLRFLVKKVKTVLTAPSLLLFLPF